MRSSDNVVAKVKELRIQGYSIPEISSVTGVSKSTVWRHIQDLILEPEILQQLKSKRGGSAVRSKKLWLESRSLATNHFADLKNSTFHLLILSCLYWAEGSKKEFSFTNSDPSMLCVVSSCLRSLGVESKDLKISIRIYEDMKNNQGKIISYWCEIIKIPKTQVISVHVLRGKKEGKLTYGMCRLTIRKSGPHFKLIQSMINVMQEHYQ